MSCKRCGSFAINHKDHGRDGSDRDLCDVCFWRKRAEQASSTNEQERPTFSPLIEDEILRFGIKTRLINAGNRTGEFASALFEFARAIEAHTVGAKK